MVLLRTGVDLSIRFRFDAGNPRDTQPEFLGGKAAFFAQKLARGGPVADSHSACRRFAEVDGGIPPCPFALILKP